MKRLVTPTLNINGNSSASLVEPLRDVMIALEAASTAMGNANDVCHGRNFQHLGGDEHVRTVNDAAQAWGERRKALVDMREEIFDLALAIQAQDKRRDRV